jgi:transcriptional regulator with XRE-family HTH domain
VAALGIAVANQDQEFGPRLRRERERRKISLDSIAASTKVSLALFEALERDDVSRWPTGIFRRSFMRAYAKAVGLDPETIVREFLERFPDPGDAPPEAAAGPAGHESGPKSLGAGLRLTLAGAPRPFAGGRVLHSVRERTAAVAVDAAVVAVMGAILFFCLGAFWIPLTIFICGYYWGCILAVGNTPGVCLLAPVSAADHANRSATPFRGRLLSSLIARFRRASEATVVGAAPGNDAVLARSK